MKMLLLASALALTTAGAAFASVTTYADGSTYNDVTGVTTTPPPAAYAMGGRQTATDALASHTTNDPSVIRSGPSYDDMGGP